MFGQDERMRIHAAATKISLSLMQAIISTNGASKWQLTHF
jgi:hypothetical protein